jgi:hypothetical protein
MSESTALPSGMVDLNFGETSWQMDLVGTMRRLQAERKRIAKEAAEKEEEPDGFAHLDLLKSLVSAAGGSAINDTQAEWLEDQLALLWADKKKERATVMRELQRAASFLE